MTLRSGWVVLSPSTPETLVSRPLILPPTRPSARAAAKDEESDIEELK